MKKMTFESKTKEEAKQQVLDAFRVSEDFITINYTEKKGMFGLKRSYDVEAYVDVDVVELGLNTLKSMFDTMEVEAEIEVDTNPDTNEIAYLINTNENPVLIGKNGKTLENIQYYLRNLLNLFTEEYQLVLVDIGGYKANRQKQLEILATKTAKEVARSKVPAKLSPMNAYERRIIHTKLSEWRDVITSSEGETPNRYLVIKPKKR